MEDIENDTTAAAPSTGSHPYLKLEVLRIAGGDLAKAKEILDWVNS